MRPGIGVVMPTHPGRSRDLLDRAVRSVWDQSYPAQHLSVANDVDRRGAGHTRQRALEGNPCEWTAFLDSDDYFARDHLAVLMAAAEREQADYVYSWFWVQQGGIEGQLLDHDPVFPPGHFLKPWDNAEPRQTTVTVMVRTELALQVGYWSVEDETTFPDGHRVGEDWHFTLGCMAAGAKIHHVVARTWIWSHHGLNTSGRPGHGDAK